MRLYKKLKPLAKNTTASISNKGLLITSTAAVSDIYVNIINTGNTVTGITFGTGNGALEGRQAYIFIPFTIRDWNSASASVQGYELY
jgi:hypothetical protein